MIKMPIVETKRLILRPFNFNDRNEVQRLAGDESIAEMTLNIPYPYKDGMAEEWIKTHEKVYKEGKGLNLAIAHKIGKYLIGAIGISIKKEYDSGELGYWIGKPYWNKGYCTEAAQAMLDYGFKEIGLNRIYANHLRKNPA
ncbi:MAG: GNAT family N-acetyltransferase [Clostridiaceae bacterium]|nr:GNAT family N-acetyltransferase [Clostridiaceae bacterium]MBW4861187.1 GNAT family N-acetyltransferase [Clostridiaceae bacterium]MBW4869931.1 GNAT family N-acetyltransferase [Clostridiaceae bacterium]